MGINIDGLKEPRLADEAYPLPELSDAAASLKRLAEALRTGTLDANIAGNLKDLWVVSGFALSFLDQSPRIVGLLAGDPNTPVAHEQLAAALEVAAVAAQAAAKAPSDAKGAIPWAIIWPAIGPILLQLLEKLLKK